MQTAFDENGRRVLAGDLRHEVEALDVKVDTRENFVHAPDLLTEVLIRVVAYLETSRRRPRVLAATLKILLNRESESAVVVRAPAWADPRCCIKERPRGLRNIWFAATCPRLDRTRAPSNARKMAAKKGRLCWGATGGG